MAVKRHLRSPQRNLAFQGRVVSEGILLRSVWCFCPEYPQDPAVLGASRLLQHNQWAVRLLVQVHSSTLDIKLVLLMGSGWRGAGIGQFASIILLGGVFWDF